MALVAFKHEHLLKDVDFNNRGSRYTINIINCTEWHLGQTVIFHYKLQLQKRNSWLVMIALLISICRTDLVLIAFSISQQLHAVSFI